MNFHERWLKAVKEKNSVLCAGLDPAEYAMGRKDKGLPEGVNKADWAKAYVRAVAPFCAALKPNIQYWKNDADLLKDITDLAHEIGMVVIDDSKLADIGSTNEAGIFYAAKRSWSGKGMDAVTVAPYAGNMEEAGKQGKIWNTGVIVMCLMSNPDYKKEKNKWVAVDPWGYDIAHIRAIDGVPHVLQYMQLAHDAQQFGLDGIVIGAPSQDNHITEEELAIARHYAGDKMLVLLPGVGAQGGEAAIIWKYFAADNVIVNVGRDLMFPHGSRSTPEQQAEAAREFRDMLNEQRKDL